MLHSLFFQFVLFLLLQFFVLSTANVIVWRTLESEMRDIFDWFLMVGVFFMGEILLVLFILGFLNLLSLPLVFAVVFGIYLLSFYFSRGLRPWEKVRYLFFQINSEWKQDATIGVFGFLILYSGVEFFNSLVQFPWEYDTISYHMPIVLEWFQTHSLWTVFYAVWGGPLGYYPTNHELFVLWQILPFGRDYLVNTVNFGVMISLLVVIYKILREMKVGKFLSWLGGALVMVMPVFLRQVGTGQVDLFMTLGVMLCVYYLFRSFKRNDGALLQPLLISFALMLGTKYLSIVYILPLLVLYLLLYRHWRHESKRWILWSVFWIGFVGSLWYWRNLILTGNPIFPAEMKVLGISIFEGYQGLMERIQELSLWLRIQEPGGWTEWISAMLKEAGPQVYLVIGAYIILLFEYFNRLLFHRLERGEGRIFTILLFLVPAYWYLYLIAPYTASMMEQNVRYAMPLLTMAMVMVIYAVEKLDHFKRVVTFGIVGLVWWEFLGLVSAERTGVQKFMDIFWIERFPAVFWLMVLVVVLIVLSFEVWRSRKRFRYVVFILTIFASYHLLSQVTDIRLHIRSESWGRQYEAFEIFEAYEFLDQVAEKMDFLEDQRSTFNESMTVSVAEGKQLGEMDPLKVQSSKRNGGMSNGVVQVAGGKELSNEGMNGSQTQNLKSLVVANTLNPVYYPLYGPNSDRKVRYVNINECSNCDYYDFHALKRGVRSVPNYWIWRDNILQQDVDYVLMGYTFRQGLENEFAYELDWVKWHPEHFELVKDGGDEYKVYRVVK